MNHLADTLVISIKFKKIVSGGAVISFRFKQVSGMRKWLIGLLVCALMVPANSLIAMPNIQSVDNTTPPCHQVQDQEQIAAQDSSSMDCCESLYQCNGNCDHECSDCFSTGHMFALFTFADEPVPSVTNHSLPVSISHNGLIPTLLWRPPCQFV